MNFSYGNEPHPPSLGADYVRYQYYVAAPKPRITVVHEQTRDVQPFADRDSLAQRLFHDEPSSPLDPLAMPAQRADIQNRQMHLLLEHLAARHAINYYMRRDLQYEECRLHAQLDEIRERPSRMGKEGRFEGDLIKQIQQLRKEYQAETVACWRDTSRILSDICDRWTEYSDQSRRARLMDIDL